ncbi:DUF6708 domain-containing protein [Stenotrophomonas sp. NPDC101269]|uniref:DUF6708 domain-containing protein n=1 Tax=Stenotrophomonas TaxID=40323 RepID=UPI001291E3AA|nr:DUF6708 domain-containing protein [Stenotrophomonas nematodicola]
MLTGWYPAFKYRRALSPEELQCELPQIETGTLTPDDSLGLVRFNSTFMEFVDRTFKIKGMAATLCAMVVSSINIFGLSALVVKAHGMSGGLMQEAIPVGIVALAVFGAQALIWTVHFRCDVFQYTHYPVRFNRVTRRIYFFRHNGPDGVVVVPWGSPYAFFHIGRGGQDPSLRDLRCHLLDRHRQVQQTFTIGHFWNHDDDIREQWALICRYMKDGPEHCFDDPLDRVITLSPKSTLRNCWMLVCLMMGTTLFPLRYTLMFPIYGALTLSRWITFKTCRAPVFPPELEAECAIAPDDPYALPEPRFMAEFASDPAIYARALQRHRERMLWR